MPFLIKHKENGLIYKDGSYEDFLRCVLTLFEDKELITKYGKAAYETIINEWNAEHAASQLLRFYENWKQGKIEPPVSGPFSAAPIIAPRKMYDVITKMQ